MVQLHHHQMINIFFVWQYGICFYEKKKNSKKYSYVNQFRTKINNSATDLVELDDNQYCVSFRFEQLIKFLDMNLKNITHVINTNKIFSSDSKNQIFLMNKNDLLLAGKSDILIIDVQKKIIINNIHFTIIGHLSFMYRLSEKMILLGGWGNYIEQIEYDEVKKTIKSISNNGKKDFNILDINSKLYQISTICEFNNNLIVSLYKNQLGNSSLIIYQLKNI
jgi:hypothetical protein